MQIDGTPSQPLLSCHEELVKAGIMLAGHGLHPSSKAKRVRFADGKKMVIDGPFAETKELIAGFWIWSDARGRVSHSMQDAGTDL